MSDQSSRPNGEALQEEEAWFHVLLDTLPFIAFTIAPGGHARHYNRTFIEYHGLVPGDDMAARTSLLHPDEQSRLVEARQVGAATQSEYVVEARLRRHDGAFRWHRIHNKPLIRSGGLVGWLGTAIDIHDVVHANEILEQRVSQRTAELRAVNQQLKAEIVQRLRTEEGLRSSETRFRMLYNRTPMALQSLDAEERLIDVNDTWLELFEYERAEVIGRWVVDFMTADSVVRYREQAWPGVQASGRVKVIDCRFRTASGRVFDGRLSASGEFDVEGRFVRSWSAIADVTAEKRADRELRQAQRMEAVGQLTSGVAHDFNNLLTAILGNLELLAKRPPRDPARAARLIAGARSAAERGAKLTSQLLAFSRQQRIAVQPVDPNAVIRGMEPLLVSTIDGNIGIVIQPDPDLSPALADPTQLELAILNLALNARDAMPQGGAITIETANAVLGEPVWPEEPAAGDYVAVCVSDTGAGISDIVRDRMFEPFFTTKEPGKGSGLGLPQVLGVVKQLGGGLAVRSAPSQGTQVSIFLPRSDRSAAAPPAVSEAEAETPSTSDRRRTILLVDDDADVRSIAAAMLNDAGHEVLEASSGAAALEALKRAEADIDLLLADIVMPGMNGVELATIVKRMSPAMPVLLMTGYADSDLLQRGAGHEVLRKPFRAAELEANVQQAMARGESARG